MIFHKSLSKKKGAAYSFFSGLSASFVPAVLIVLFLSIFMTVSPVFNFIDVNSGSITIGSNDAAAKARESFKFFVFDIIDSSFTLYLILGVLGILAIFTAVRIFSFICDKRTVNVYYSLGIKRSVLFISKYFSGALLLCSATAIAVILSYIANLIFLGASWQLSLVLLHFYCGISVFLLICYSITAAVFSSVGTVSEAIVYSVAVLFAPTIIIFITENIIAAFLPSSTLNMYFEFFNDSRHNRYYDTSLLEATASYNPVLFFAEELKNFSRADLEKGEIFLTYAKSGWVFPNIFLPVPWFIIAVAVGALGAVLFRRIKAENCGFLNTNKLLSNLTIFELCLFGSSILLSEMEWNGIGITVGIGIAAAFGLYLIAEIFLKRNFIKILKALYKFVAHMAVIAIIFTVCATGAFGYGEYIPDKAKIESVEIALPLSYSQITTKEMSFGGIFDGFTRIYDQFHPCFMPKMTDSDDIDTVMEINRKINQIEKEGGPDNQVIIRYNLKNGGYSERRHILTANEEYELLFELFDTKAYKNELKRLIYESDGVEELKEEFNRYGWVDDASVKALAFLYEYSEVTARTSSLQENRVLDLTEEEFTRLKDAVYKDLSAQKGKEYLKAEHRQLGILSFGINEKATQIEGINNYTGNIVFEEEMTTPALPDVTVPEDENEEIFPEDIIFPEEEQTPSLYSDENNIPYNAFGGLEYNSDYDVLVTENMTNTLQVLESIGLKDCFVSQLTIESVSFGKYNPTKFFGTSNTDSIIREFFSYPILKDDYIYQYENDKDFIFEDHYAENKITDKEKIKNLDSLMKLHEFTFDSGYICLVKYTDDLYCIRYLSEEDAPEYVKNFNYKMDSEDLYYW